MSQTRKPGVTLDHSLRRRPRGERPQPRRTAAERLSQLSEIAKAAIRGEHADGNGTGAHVDSPTEAFSAVSQNGTQPIAEPDYPVDDTDTTWYEQVVPRFPIVRNGYDCGTVDEYIAGLERELSELDHELAELRARTPTREEIEAELKRVGEQTSAILLEAHERARETTTQAQEQAQRRLTEARAEADRRLAEAREDADRRVLTAREEADRRVSEALTRAAAITEESERKRDEIQRDIDRLVAEWNRLLANVEGVAGTLSTVARESKARVAPSVGAAPPAGSPPATGASPTPGGPPPGQVSERPEGGATGAGTGS